MITDAPRLRDRVERFEGSWRVPRGFAGWFATVNNSDLGARYMVTSLGFFAAAGVMALFMRLQLSVPENTFLDPETYNQLFTMHGSTMMYLFVVPFLEGLANFILPQMLGARDLAYPRLTAFGYWLYLFGGLVFFSSFLVDAVPDAGWFAYPPLSGIDFSGLAMDFWLLGLGAIELGGIATGIELAVTVLKLRAVGMTLNRVPPLAWAFLIMALAIVVAFTVLLVATLLLELDRAFGFNFFDPVAGGNPLLWQHLFWIFGHPEVYIMFIPATGIVSMIVPTFARRPLAAYLYVVLAMILTGFVSFGLWAHHMFTTGLPLVAAGFFTAASMMIALASGTQVFAWIATLWGSRPRLAAPMKFVIGFVVIFLLGGVTGVMVASVPLDAQVHDTHFVVAHFHYVLIGGVVFPIMAALYYWMPLLSGKLLSERLGTWNFWLTFVGFNMTFFPLHIAGLLGMPRRVYTYPPGLGLEPYNLISTIGAFVLAAGFASLLVNLVLSVRRGVDAPADPWGAGTLEWAVPLPTPNYNFRAPPVVRSLYPLWGAGEGRAEERARDADAATADAAGEAPDADRAIPEGYAAGRWPGVTFDPRLDAIPSTFRATPVTSVIDAVPQGIWNLTGPSYVPILTALGVTLAALGPIVSAYWLSGAGAVLAAVCLAVWLWPTPDERERVLARREREEYEDPPDAPEFSRRLVGKDTAEPGLWGVAMFLGSGAVVYGTLLFAYFYLRLYSSAWPQGAVPLPELALPAAAAVLLLLSGWPVVAGTRAIRRGNARGLKNWLGMGLVLGLAFLGLHVWNVARAGFVPSLNAYASVFHGLAGLVSLMTLLALAIQFAVWLRALRGHFDSVYNAAAQHSGLVWGFTVAANLVAYAVLYLAPRLAGFGS